MPQTVPPSQTPPPGGQTLPPRPTGALTHAGRVRRANEDGVFAAPARGLWAVADGMGGHMGGAEAAAEVTGALEDLAASLPRGTGLDAALDAMAAAIGDASGRIAARAAAIPGAVIGATVVALAIRGTGWGCLWAGDSRAYRLRDGRLEQLTRDHTEANDLRDAGVISAEEARTWPRANVVTRAVGVEPAVALDRATGRLAPGDVFLLCSDGLMKHVPDDEIAAALAATGATDPEGTAEALLARTLERGARDNVTVVVVSAGDGAEGQA